MFRTAQLPLAKGFHWAKMKDKKGRVKRKSVLLCVSNKSRTATDSKFSCHSW